jgi:hypothetical protein
MALYVSQQRHAHLTAACASLKASHATASLLGAGNGFLFIVLQAGVGWWTAAVISGLLHYAITRVGMLMFWSSLARAGSHVARSLLESWRWS